MAGRLDRLRRRISTKRRSTVVTIEVVDPSPNLEDCDDTQRELTTSSEEEGFKAADTAAAFTSSTPATHTISFEEGKRLFQFQQQYHDVRNRLAISPKKTEVSPLPSSTYSTVNYFAPSVVENVESHTYADDKMNNSSTCPKTKKETTNCKTSSRFVVNEISLVDMDDVSDIENPDQIDEEENNGFFSVLNEKLCHTIHSQSDLMDNDIISLPHLTIVTPEDGEKSGGRNNCSRRNSSFSLQTPYLNVNENLQTYIGDSYNDIIQALSSNTRGCGLNETFSVLDEIRNALFQ